MRSSGMNAFMDSYINALAENSVEICNVLEAISKKELSTSDKNQISKVKRELNKLDKDLRQIGG